ncbi:MAG: sulfotransferase domain-containing protein [Acidimicrobiales bacterium]|nr:sulfotransferase domain-containing protein [Acidimicrobiales bacterium]
MRRYFGFLADSDRWRSLPLRDDDIVISTPSKCGTTWTQTIVGMLLVGRADLGAPLSELSPWLDMQIRTTDEVVARLEAQRHRRFIKTHTPLDGLPEHDSVTFLAVVRHPLDVALSDRDHGHNAAEALHDLRYAAVGNKDLDELAPRVEPPDDPAEYLRWFIDSDLPPTGSGPNSLADFCQQAAIAWARRDRPNVHLFHYEDLCADTDGEMRRIADALGIEVDADVWPTLVDAASIDAMRARASEVAPDAQHGIWHSDRDFFRRGGRRNWADLLDADDLAHYGARLDELAGDAADWIRHGRRSLPIPKAPF